MRQFSNPVVPVAVHQVFGNICGSLVQSRVRIFRGLDITVHITDIQHFAFVWGKLELTDAFLYVADLLSPHK